MGGGDLAVKPSSDGGDTRPQLTLKSSSTKVYRYNRTRNQSRKGAGCPGKRRASGQRFTRGPKKVQPVTTSLSLGRVLVLNGPMG